MVNDIEALISQYKNLKQLLSEKTSSSIIDMVQPFFEKDKDLKEIRWTQYTNHFNDGDTCEFGTRMWEMDDEIRKELEKIPQEIFLDAFGDHMEIILHRDGTITVNDFTDHD